MLRKSLGVLVSPKLLLGVICLCAAIAFLSVLVSVFGNNSVKLTYVGALISLISVLGLTVFSGNSGILSFGHVGFVALGAQISATLTTPTAIKTGALPLLPDVIKQIQLDLPAAILVTLLLVGLFALIVSIPIGRLSGPSASISTLGLLIIVTSLLVGAQGITRGSQAMYGIPPLTTVAVATVAALIVILVARAYRDSVPGLMLRSSREDEAAAFAIGIDVVRHRRIAFVISAMICALAGVLFAHSITVFSSRSFTLDMTFSLIVMYVVGGAGSVTGAVAGATSVTLLIEILRRIEPGIQIGSLAIPQVFGLTVVGLSLAIILVLIKRRQGLFGLQEIDDILLQDRRVTAGAAVVQTPAATDLQTLELAHVTKAYGGVVALDDVSFCLNAGEILGLVGPNGSGKTTALGCLAGTHQLTGGQVKLSGKDVTGWPAYKIARAGVGRSFQTVRLFSRLTVLENVKGALAQSFGGLSHAEMEAMAVSLLETLGIADRQNDHANELAYGLQRRLEIARAIATNPRFLLLDEPAAGMNEVETADLLITLRKVVDEHNIGLLIVDHDISLITGLCDRVIVLNKGQLIANGKPNEVWSIPEVREAYMGRRSLENQQ